MFILDRDERLKGKGAFQLPPPKSSDPPFPLPSKGIKKDSRLLQRRALPSLSAHLEKINTHYYLVTHVFSLILPAVFVEIFRTICDNFSCYKSIVLLSFTLISKWAGTENFCCNMIFGGILVVVKARIIFPSDILPVKYFNTGHHHHHGNNPPCQCTNNLLNIWFRITNFYRGRPYQLPGRPQYSAFYTRKTIFYDLVDKVYEVRL